MASRYKFNEEEIEQIVTTRKENKDKRAEARLKALELRARGLRSENVAKEKVMPRSKHPKKASEEVIETSKK